MTAEHEHIEINQMHSGRQVAIIIKGNITVLEFKVISLYEKLIHG